jgi:hypothetical protein
MCSRIAMNKKRIIVGIILLAAAIVAWLWIGNVRQPGAAITSTEPKVGNLRP